MWSTLHGSVIVLKSVSGATTISLDFQRIVSAARQNSSSAILRSTWFKWMRDSVTGSWFNLLFHLGGSRCSRSWCKATFIKCFLNFFKSFTRPALLILLECQMWFIVLANLAKSSMSTFDRMNKQFTLRRFSLDHKGVESSIQAFFEGNCKWISLVVVNALLCVRLTIPSDFNPLIPLAKVPRLEHVQFEE